MKRIRLTFTNENYVIALLADNKFLSDTSYLNPIAENHSIVFTDPVPTHNDLDTEDVVITLSANAIKRIYRQLQGNIQYINPIDNGQFKGGFLIGNRPIVNATEIIRIDN